jgi:hypothetical protein
LAKSYGIYKSLFKFYIINLLQYIFKRKEADFVEIMRLIISKNLTNLQPKRYITKKLDKFYTDSKSII